MTVRGRASGVAEDGPPREQEQPALPSRVEFPASVRARSGPASRMPDDPAPPSRVELPPEVLVDDVPPEPPTGVEPPRLPLETDELEIPPVLTEPAREPAELEETPPVRDDSVVPP
jgi:hypothetical protein